MKKFEDALCCLLCSLFLMIFVNDASGLCDAGRFGPDCRYVCHCGDGSESCNEESGVCLSGQICARGFHGTNCQKENVALDKPASQISTYMHNDFSYGASLAVDGNTSTNFSDRSCARTIRMPVENIWWRVDLREEYNIRYIRVYRERGYFSSPLRMRILIDRRSCHSLILDTNSIIDIDCRHIIRGRTVTIDNYNYRENTQTLCEVQIFVCTDFWFGENCDETCNCRDITEVCDKLTGACLSGCSDGFKTTESCTTECDDHLFGEDCVHTCNCRDETEVCNKVTGVCSSGCAAGFQGSNCTTACPDYWFHSDCSQACNCRDETEVCNKTTGACTSGCAAGFQGGDCKTECDNDLFGENCVQTCNCRSESELCNKATGACSSGCAVGFQGDDCKTVCPDYWFGNDCRQTCSCKNETEVCSKTTGACLSGCRYGFHGDDCKTACSKRQYDPTCPKSCDSCATPSAGEHKCDRVTGQCFFGCIPGYRNRFCNRTCDSGRHGLYCSNMCSDRCKATDNGLPICDHVTGTCTAGCQDGYISTSESVCDMDLTSLDGGQIAGIVIGCLMGIGLIVALLVVYILKRRKPKPDRGHTGIEEHSYQDLVDRIDNSKSEERIVKTKTIEYETDVQEGEYSEIAVATAQDHEHKQTVKNTNDGAKDQHIYCNADPAVQTHRKKLNKPSIC